MSQRFPTPNVTAGPAGGPPQRYPMRPSYSPQPFPVSLYYFVCFSSEMTRFADTVCFIAATQLHAASSNAWRLRAESAATSESKLSKANADDAWKAT